MLQLPRWPRGVNSEIDLATARPGTIRRILYVAVREWSFFGGTVRGKHVRHNGHTETQKGYSQLVGVYWRQGTGKHLTGKNTDVPWSATFVSYVMREAGLSNHDFRRASAHSKYIHHAIHNGLAHQPGAAFVGRRVEEYRPKEGDVVCKTRNHSGITFKKAAKRDAYQSHCDIVAFVRTGEMGVIGGNVSDSVTLTIVPLTSSGHLKENSGGYFAILENRLPLK